jgi:phosphoserine phosphatase RsbU/P
MQNIAEDTRPRLKVRESDFQERTILLDKSIFCIGRRGENDLRINEAHISRNHAEIIKEDDRFTLVDKESKTGTYVNGQRIRSLSLNHLDRIQFGTSAYPQIIFLNGEEMEVEPVLKSQASVVLESFGRKDFSNMKRLLETARMFTGAVPLGEILDYVLDTSIEITNAERAFIVLKDEKGVARFQKGRNQQKQTVPEEQFRITRTILDNVIAGGKKVLLTDVTQESESRMSESIQDLDLRSIICLPLMRFEIHDSVLEPTLAWKVIGALYLDSRIVGESLSKISEHILDSLAADAGTVVENARLLKQAREKDRLELELATAREIQAALLPKIHGSYEFFEAAARNIPSRHISGDYYDLIKLSESSYAFTIADVTGKGVSAAILSSALQGMLYVEASKPGSLSTCIENVNLYLVQRSGSEKFVTLFYGVLNSDGRLNFVNGGHNPPYLIRANGELEELTSPGVILGAFDIAKYPENFVHLQQGDLLFLYTDGITEARDIKGEMLGEDRLKEFLMSQRNESLDSLLDKVVKKVQEHSSGIPQSDDVTVLLLKFIGNQS